MKSIFLRAYAFLALATITQAEIIGVEQFDYSDGAIAGQNGGTFWNWRNRTPAGRTAGTSDWDNVENTPSVASGRLEMGGSGQNAVTREYNGPSEGSGADIDRDDGLGAINNFIGAISFQEKKVYYRVTVRTGATLPDYFGLSSHDFSTEKLFFGKRGGSSTFGLESVGIGGTNGTRTIDPNTTYTLVVRIDYVAGTIALFVDPSLNVDETSQFSISRTFDTSFWSTAVRLSAGGGGDPVQWDDLVVATTWEDLGTEVTTATDEDNGSLNPASGTGISLREAVKYSPTGSLITFLPGLSGQTITLTGGQLLITKSLTIDASALAGGITIDANGAVTNHRVMEIQPNTTVTLRGLTLTGGRATVGGIPAVSGGAIYANGSGSGNSVRLTLIACTLSGNTAGEGGGILINGSQGNATLSLTSCTLSGNSAGFGGGGGIVIAGLDGSVTLNLTSCTLSGNSADDLGGGGIVIAGTSGTATLNLHNTILAGNTAPTGPDLLEIDATTTATGSNLMSSTAGSTLGANPANITIVADPKLSPLGYFGGPVQTMHPLIGSPAIDAAGTTDPGGTDARGFPRVVDGDTASSGAQLDIGAVEAGPLRTVTASHDNAGSTLSLRGRIGLSTEPGARIGFFTNNFPAQTITLNGTQLDIPATPGLFIDASNLTVPVTISGNPTSSSRVFYVPATATVAMHSLRIVNGSIPINEKGGGIYNSGTCTVMSSTLSGNSATSGGGIHNDGTCTVLSSTLSGNSAFGGGGMLNDGTCLVVSSTFSGNSGGNSGGGIRNQPNGTCLVVSSTFSGNSAGQGGGIRNLDGNCRIVSCTFSGNSATTSGGGISNSNSGTCTVLSSTLSGNSASVEGGGIEANGVFHLNFSIVGGNPAPGGSEISGATSGTSGNNLPIGTDPLLGPLANNGGPTQTMRLLPGSPARDAGAASARTTDQRGFPMLGTPDIGAYEAQFGPIADVTMVENTAPPTRNFTVGQIGTLSVASSNTALVPLANISLTGSGASRSITATPAANQLGSSTLTLTDSLRGETQTYTVTVTLDPAFVVSNTDPSGPGSLTQALINAANAAGPNTITFASGFPNEIFPTGEFFITDTEPVAIDATSVSGGLTLSAPAGSRHFQVPVGKTLTLRGLILVNGDAGGDGGSIYNEGTLHLERCALRYNDSPFSGGAVACVGAASVFTATGCSFSENNANGNGGAINCVSGTVTLTQCTLAMNSAPASLSAGGLQMNGGSLNLIHCTLSTNSGGLTGGLYLESVPVANITHSIIAGNTKTNTTPADIFANASPIIPSGANLIGNNEGAESVFPAGPLVGTAAAPLNPDLSALGDYGGPTATMPPNVNSPAIDQASVLSPALTTDQRGEPRPLGVRPDLGAVESSVIIVTTPVDELDAPGALGNGVSLREAVRDIPAGGTIGFDRAVFNSLTTNTITLTKGPLNPQQECTLNGSINPGSITVIYKPEITQQPQPASVAVGAPAIFSTTVTALSDGLIGEWFKNGVGTGITTPVLNFPNAQEADEGVYFQQIIEAPAATINTDGNVVLGFFIITSQPASLTVDGAPVTILRSSVGYTIDLGGSHTLSVIAVGSAPLTYQWFKAGKAIAGATKSSYTIPKAALSHAGAYTCVVKSGNTSPGVTSTTAEISVVDTREKRVSLKAGSKFTSTVIAAGNGLSYQWNRMGSGGTTKTLTINSVSVADAGQVSCEVNAPSDYRLQGGIVELFVSNAVPGLVTPLAPPTAYIGQNYFYQLPVVNTPGAPAVSFSLTGALPSGLTFNKTTGILSGRPKVTKSAGYALSFKAINASGSSAPTTATLQVIAVPQTILGSFSGPLERSALNGNLGGRFALTVSKTGTFSGSVMFGALKRSFKSQLVLSAGQGDAILRGNITGLKLADDTLVTAYVEFFVAEQLARLTLIRSDGITLDGTGWRKIAPAVAKTVTFRLDPGIVSGAPQGFGYGSFKVSATNSLRFTGKLPDGSSLLGSTFVGPTGQVLVFQLLYGKKGSLVGQYQLTGDDLTGSVSWFKSFTTTGSVYKDGFGPLNVAAAGGLYTPPAAGQIVMQANSSIYFSEGGITGDFSQLVTIANPKATGLTNTAKPVLPLTNNTRITKFDVKTGLMTGSFQEGTRLAPWSGLLVKIGGTTRAYGYFLLPEGTPTGPKLSGRVVLGAP